MSLQSGTRLGPYEIVAPIGAGGMGEVYKATDTRLDRTVAIKVLPPHSPSDPDMQQRFEREAQTIAALNHPHICTLHDVGRRRDTDFLVMEYLEGETLADATRQGPLPFERGAAGRHRNRGRSGRGPPPGRHPPRPEAGQRHADRNGAKLLDFGLAKPRRAAGVRGPGAKSSRRRPKLTAPGTILGTFQYMAPEQLEGRKPTRGPTSSRSAPSSTRW